MAKADKLFKQTYTWFKQSVDQMLSHVQPANQIPGAQSLVWQMLGVLNSTAPLQYARSCDGKAWLWIGPSKLAGRGQAESNLRFDVVEKLVLCAKGDSFSYSRLIPKRCSVRERW
jgi:hypothetical protein